MYSYLDCKVYCYFPSDTPCLQAPLQKMLALVSESCKISLVVKELIEVKCTHLKLFFKILNIINLEALYTIHFFVVFNLSTVKFLSSHLGLHL